MADPHGPIAERVLTYRNLAEASGGRLHLDPALILAVIHQESGGDPDAYRVECPLRDASFGLMQMLLSTARGLGYGGPPRQLFDPVTSIELGAQDLASGVKTYGDEYLALVDYNGGPMAVRWFRMGYKRGPAVHYANVVFALRDYYRRRLAVLAGSAVPHG